MKAEVAIFISDNTDLKIQTVARHRWNLHDKGPSQKEYITVTNIYAPNVASPK